MYAVQSSRVAISSINLLSDHIFNHLVFLVSYLMVLSIKKRVYNVYWVSGCIKVILRREILLSFTAFTSKILR